MMVQAFIIPMSKKSQPFGCKRSYQASTPVFAPLLPMSASSSEEKENEDMYRGSTPEEENESTQSNDDEEGSSVFYNDFGDDFVGGNNDNFSSASSTDQSSSVLQGRLEQLSKDEEGQQAQVLQNWNQGHWTVRGCSLDPEQQAVSYTHLTLPTKA